MQGNSSKRQEYHILPNLSRPQEKKLVGIGQIATIVIVVLGILWIPIMRSVGDVLYTYLQDVQSVLAPGIAAAFLLGICWKRTSAQGGMWGLISGMVIGLTRLGAKVYYSNAVGASVARLTTITTIIQNRNIHPQKNNQFMS